MASLRLVLFGPPGAGKGTQAQLLRDGLNIPHISSGDLFRYHLQGETRLRIRAASSCVKRGVVLPGPEDGVSTRFISNQVKRRLGSMDAGLGIWGEMAIGRSKFFCSGGLLTSP